MVIIHLSHHVGENIILKLGDMWYIFSVWEWDTPHPRFFISSESQFFWKMFLNIIRLREKKKLFEKRVEFAIRTVWLSWFGHVNFPPESLSFSESWYFALLNGWIDSARESGVVEKKVACDTVGQSLASLESEQKWSELNFLLWTLRSNQSDLWMTSSHHGHHHHR